MILRVVSNNRLIAYNVFHILDADEISRKLPRKNPKSLSFQKILTSQKQISLIMTVKKKYLGKNKVCRLYHFQQQKFYLITSIDKHVQCCIKLKKYTLNRLYTVKIYDQ